MVLDQLRDGASRHLSAARLDEGTKELAFILGLPLIDGVFATLLVTGAVSTFSQAITVALSIFTGAGAIAVLYSNSDSRSEARRMVGKVAPVILVGALLVSLVAPVFRSLFYVQRLELAAGLVLLLIAGKMFGIELAEKISPASILVTGMVLSLQSPSSFSFSMSYAAPALLTAGTALAVLYLLAVVRPPSMNTYYLRVGSAVALLVLSATLFGASIPSNLATAVMIGSLVIAVRPRQLLSNAEPVNS